MATAAATLSALSSSRETGLRSEDAAARLEREGANEVPEKKAHLLGRLARKFWGLSAWMIELIVVLSFILHKRADLWVALSLLVVNAVLSFLQEQRASAAVAALRHRLQVAARVLRDGAWQTIPARESRPRRHRPGPRPATSFRPTCRLSRGHCRSTSPRSPASRSELDKDE